MNSRGDAVLAFDGGDSVLAFEGAHSGLSVRRSGRTH
jgi:hypothetical protein